mmetsp:Transcript_91470/g.295988  ORF Transcript_91470/g.295988 Transcript_91470/m.295988 type:complete len:202 (-) Transcript_91470:11-616(-)
MDELGVPAQLVPQLEEHPELSDPGDLINTQALRRRCRRLTAPHSDALDLPLAEQRLENEADASRALPRARGEVDARDLLGDFRRGSKQAFGPSVKTGLGLLCTCLQATAPPLLLLRPPCGSGSQSCGQRRSSHHCRGCERWNAASGVYGKTRGNTSPCVACAPLQCSDVPCRSQGCTVHRGRRSRVAAEQLGRGCTRHLSL